MQILPPELRAQARRAPPPGFIPPMLATLTAKRFSDPAWLFERKLDGERCLAFRRGESLDLFSRNEKRIGRTYPELRDALLAQSAADFIADGEIVAFEGSRTSFSRLQGRMQVRDPEPILRRRIPVYYYLFDLLYLDGYDLRRLPLRYRKLLLRQALAFGGRIRFCAHREQEGEAYFREACDEGWEGLIAKRADSPYVSRRSTDWLKFKCVLEQEFVVGGYTDPRGSRVGFGAILAGYYRGKDLIYAGMVGTGFDAKTLRRLKEKFSALERSRSPFASSDVPRKDAHWLEPKLVAQVGFTEWSAGGRLRHPRFLGLRRDKTPADVVRETPTVSHDSA